MGHIMVASNCNQNFVKHYPYISKHISFFIVSTTMDIPDDFTKNNQIIVLKSASNQKYLSMNYKQWGYTIEASKDGVDSFSKFKLHKDDSDENTITIEAIKKPEEYLKM